MSSQKTKINEKSFGSQVYNSHWFYRLHPATVLFLWLVGIGCIMYGIIWAEDKRREADIKRWHKDR